MRQLALLLLQGPASPFLKEVASVAERHGATVNKINTCLGDAIFWWPRKADWFNGTNEEWPVYLRRYLRDHGITDILMLGDGRPRHAAAIEIAQELGIRAHIFEHGYLRPDWLTLEPFGMSGRSRFPTDPQVIRELANSVPEPRFEACFKSSFLTYAFYDLAFHLPNVALGWLLHPNYRTHGPVHPLVEYSGWIGKMLTARARDRKAEQIERHYLEGMDAPYFIFPLQLPGDYQIKIHSPIGDLFNQVEAVINSFARHAPQDARLLFKTHPLDNGLSRWKEKTAEWGDRAGISGRVDLIDGGNLDHLIAKAQGVVTINSTVGLTALLAHKPVITLGAAIYDLPGLTHQDSLASFWRDPTPPDTDMPMVFARALIATIQFRGGFIGRQAIETGARELFRHIIAEPGWQSVESMRKRSVFRYETELRGFATA